VAVAFPITGFPVALPALSGTATATRAAAVTNVMNKRRMDPFFQVGEYSVLSFGRKPGELNEPIRGNS